MLVAVSGGRDSVALLHALRLGGHKKLTVIHLDHGLRGRSSAADARFVTRLAKAWNFPCIVGKADTRSYARARGISTETAARELRHAFFAACARRLRCRVIVLGHHADDQAETCLFRFLRGAGTAGLAGMERETALQVGRLRLTLVRPLLAVRRSEIDTYVREHRIPFREDATNATLDVTRNRIRHGVLPAIREAMGDTAIDAILRAAEILRAENEWAAEEAAKVPQGPDLFVKDLRGRPVALQRRVIHRWLTENGVSGVGFDLVEQVRELLDSGATRAKVNLPGGAHCRRQAGRMFLQPPCDLKASSARSRAAA